MIYAENVLMCIAIPLVITSLFLQKGARRFVIFFLFGMTICLLSAYVGGLAQVSSGMDATEVSVYISPITEELMKLFPILFYMILLEPGNEKLFQAAIGIGAGFATFENCCYVLTSGASDLSYVLIRGLAVGVMHIISMAALAIGLQLLKKYGIFSVSGVMGATSLSITFHALYNLLVSKPGIPSYIGYAFPLFAAMILYSKYRSKLIE